MRFAKTSKSNPATSGQSGFTLAEVLAAMLFMAIVIPVAVQGLRVASLAGEAALRKAQAMRIADGILNDALISSNYISSTQSGTITEGLREFQYFVTSEPWDQPLTNQLTGLNVQSRAMVAQPQVDQFAVTQVKMNLLTAEVLYMVQGKEYSVHLNTLMSSE